MSIRGIVICEGNYTATITLPTKAEMDAYRQGIADIEHYAADAGFKAANTYVLTLADLKCPNTKVEDIERIKRHLS
jgi:hypothetical protein